MGSRSKSLTCDKIAKFCPILVIFFLIGLIFNVLQLPNVTIFIKQAQHSVLDSRSFSRSLQGQNIFLKKIRIGSPIKYCKHI